MCLVENLKKFNRKERYFLLQILLEKSNGRDQVSIDISFINILSERLGVVVPTTAQWFFDYHIDWILGALYLTYGGNVKDELLASGTQIDVDFLIAFGNNLICIEAKADTSWDVVQFKKKKQRILDIARRFKDVEIHMVLMSPKEPNEKYKLKENPEGIIKNVLYIPMGFDFDNKLRVSRWSHEHGKASSTNFDGWEVVKNRTGKPLSEK